MNKRGSALASVVAGAVVLTGCGTDWDEAPNYYKPAAYGENNKCYYVKYEDEAEELKEEGFCEDDDVIVVMPNYWLLMYSPYYFSPEYRNYYVPKKHRKAFKSYGTAFTIKNNEAIRKAQEKATYTDNNGNKVKGNKVDTNKFGGGQKSSGGSGVRICAAGASNVVVVAGRGGGGSRSGSGGGAPRTGGSSGGSGGSAPKGVTRGGC